MKDALYELAKAVTGQNSAMQWSLSDSILRRQITPVFQRCAEGVITAECALDIAMDFTTAGVSNNVEILEDLYTRVSRKADTQYPGCSFPSLAKMQEFLMGLDPDAEWATSDNITRKEMYPLFVRLSVGRSEVTDSVITFCDHIFSKRAFYFELLQELTEQFTAEILAAHHAKEESTDGDS